ncbi:MAG: hypothetical protein KC635_10905 [Myxococcales bacterium]|nr:hypothetical protein [Myxococcales bacterium]MCB9731694.1 hypothetical protein [Deltaproteobacteria bacterium]
MKDKDILDISGVFLAVKCAICETIYPADSDDFVAFFGSVTAGFDKVLIGVDPPRKPAKRAVTVVCRDPRCVSGLARKMMGCEDDPPLWAQALKIWANEAGHDLVESPETKPAPPEKKLRRA